MLNKIKNVLKKPFMFLRLHKMLIKLFLIFIFTIIQSLYFKHFKGISTWKISISFSLLLIVLGLFYYADEISDWLFHKATKKIHNLFVLLLKISFLISPLLLFCTGLNLSNFFYASASEKTNIFSWLLILNLIIFNFFFIVKYIYDLFSIKKNYHFLWKRIILFIISILHIILLFTNIFACILILDEKAIIGLSTSSNLNLYFDLTYFSTMTFLTASCTISPVSILAKIVVIIETFSFAIIISLILFGFVDEDKKEISNSIENKD